MPWRAGYFPRHDICDGLLRGLGLVNLLTTKTRPRSGLGTFRPSAKDIAVNHLYYGDNLRVLRDSIKDDSVDLIYLDPPFNSNASYNVLFKGRAGTDSAAQIEAFDDTLHWTFDGFEVAIGELEGPEHFSCRRPVV